MRSELPTLADARRAFDVAILKVLMKGYVPEYGRCEAAFNLRAFSSLDLPRDLVTAVLRDLRDKGLCTFERGLMSEDGGMGGSGYMLTAKGIEAYFEMSGAPRPRTLMDVCQCS
mgnify:CR=1 FL=1